MEEESCCVPPGFRFHPTEEELVGYYLARKVASQKIDMDIIQEVDLYRMEPWDLQERCKQGGDQEQATEWYFFSYKDRKYPSGTRTNRATAAGFWKATGRDKPVLSSSSVVIGMRKTLVFYKGRAPNGRKTDWIMHEYRLQSTQEHAPPQEEGWVVCRAFQKPLPNLLLQQHIRPSSSSSLLCHHHHHPCTPAGYYDLINTPHFGSSSSSSYYSSARPALAADLVFRPHHHQLPAYADDEDDDLFESKKQHRLLFSSSIPPLQSPSAIVSDGYHTCTPVGGGADHDHMIHQQQLQGGQPAAIDWNFLDSLLQSTTTTQLQADPSASLDY